MRIRPIALCFGLAVTPGFAVTAHAATYTFTLLQDAGGVQDNKVLAINSLGESVGWSAISSGYEAVLWSATGTPTVLADLGGEDDSAARAINASGESAGWSDTATGDDAVLWSSSGTATPLGKGGEVPTSAVAINAKGESVGYVKTKNGLDDAVLWHPNGVGTTLGDPGGQGVAQALAINGSGQSAGFVDIASPPACPRRCCGGPRGTRRCFRTWRAARVTAKLSPSTPPASAWAGLSNRERRRRGAVVADGDPNGASAASRAALVSVAVAENNVGHEHRIFRHREGRRGNSVGAQRGHHRCLRIQAA